MMYWIKDQDDTPQRFPLKLLFLLILAALGSKPVQLWVKRSRGYGIQVCKWDDLLNDKDEILVKKEALEILLEGTKEWFYDLDVEIIYDDLTVRFGLHDSTAMYIEAPKKIANLIIDKFKDVVEVLESGNGN